jgi:hypothetical protein
VWSAADHAALLAALDEVEARARACHLWLPPAPPPTVTTADAAAEAQAALNRAVHADLQRWQQAAAHMRLPAPGGTDATAARP